ncbi:MAG: hypothetical protein OJF50_000656 [Nitrospira sp.]|nr:hypothetical protein [Nitrospira sp.]
MASTFPKKRRKDVSSVFLVESLAEMVFSSATKQDSVPLKD